jgi:glucosamine--fructose-6-phosphate aminotransferase (isomerizing)
MPPAPPLRRSRDSAEALRVTQLFEREIREQPDALARLLDRGRAAAEAAAIAIRTHGPRFAMIAARGTSDNAARYGQYLFGIHNRLTVASSAPSLFTHYDAAPRLESAVVIGISQSGQSPDVVAVVRAGRAQGAVTVAITNDPGSPLAHAAAFSLPLHAGPEQAVAATKTYTAELLALAMLSAGIEADEARWKELARVPTHVATALDLHSGDPRDMAALRDVRSLVVVGRGYNLSTTFEVALKIKETCYVMSEAYSSADFLHGPVALLEEGLPVLVVAPTSRSFDDLNEVVRLARERGAPLVAISDSPALLASADVFLALPADVPEWLSPMVAVVPGQLFAGDLARARGLTPDAPRGLKKVTLTR